MGEWRYVINSVHVQCMGALREGEREKKKTNITNLVSEALCTSSTLTHLLRQMLEMWLVMWSRSYLRVRLHEVMAIEIAGLSEGLRVDVVHLALRR